MVLFCLVVVVFVCRFTQRLKKYLVAFRGVPVVHLLDPVERLDGGQLVRVALACVYIVFKPFCLQFVLFFSNHSVFNLCSLCSNHSLLNSGSNSQTKHCVLKILWYLCTLCTWASLPQAKSSSWGRVRSRWTAGPPLSAWPRGRAARRTFWKRLSFVFFLLFFEFFSPPHQLVHFAGEPRFVAKTPDQPVYPLLGRVALVPDLWGSFLIQSEYILLHLRWGSFFDLDYVANNGRN